jgi:hypothetical protein
MTYKNEIKRFILGGPKKYENEAPETYTSIIMPFWSKK